MVSISAAASSSLLLLTRSGNNACYSSTSDDEVMFDVGGSSRSKTVTGSTLLSNLSDEEKQIEVHATVDPYQEFTDPPVQQVHPAIRQLEPELDSNKHASRAASTRTLVSGPGTAVRRDEGPLLLVWEAFFPHADM